MHCVRHFNAKRGFIVVSACPSVREFVVKTSLMHVPYVKQFLLRHHLLPVQRYSQNTFFCAYTGMSRIPDIWSPGNRRLGHYVTTVYQEARCMAFSPKRSYALSSVYSCKSLMVLYW